MQRHNFTIYLETGGNANVKSILDSYQYSNNVTTLCIWAWERFRPSVCNRLQKKYEKKVLDVQFPLTKKLATTQDHQILQNSDEKQDCQFWILRLVVFTRFPANRDCLLKLDMLVKSRRTVSRELHWGKRVYVELTSWLTEGVVILLCFCAKRVFVVFIIGLSQAYGKAFYWGGRKNCPENSNLLWKQAIFPGALKLTFLVQSEWGLKPLINLFCTVEFVYNGFVCNVDSPIMLHFVRSRWHFLHAFQFAWNVNWAIMFIMQSPRGAVTGKFCSYLAC